MITTTPLPSVFLSHGAPVLADDLEWPGQLATWSAALPTPDSILIVSAHWEDAPTTLSATRDAAPLVYDFWGFPQRYYDVTYSAPGAPALADRVEALLCASGRLVGRDDDRGLDHGAYVPLMEMYPDANVPVLQMSMPTLDPRALFSLGEQLAPLRDEGVLIIGSGFATHNLGAVSMGAGSDQPVPTWSQEFDHWLAETASVGDLDGLLDFTRKAPAPHLAHPRTEHLAPLFVTLGAAAHTSTASPTTAIDGFWYGLSKRSLQWD